MSSAKAYKSIKRRMASMKDKPAKPVVKEESAGLLQRKGGSKEEMPEENMQDVIAKYIEAVRGVEE